MLKVVSSDIRRKGRKGVGCLCWLSFAGEASTGHLALVILKASETLMKAVTAAIY